MNELMQDVAIGAALAATKTIWGSPDETVVFQKAYLIVLAALESFAAHRGKVRLEPSVN